MFVRGSKEGVSLIKDKIPENTKMWIADKDNEINIKTYINTGVCDALDI